MAPFFSPLVCGKLTIHLQTHKHSLLHFLGTYACPHSTVMAIYSHTRAYRLIYVCADVEAAGDHVGWGGSTVGGEVLKNSEAGESWVSLQRRSVIYIRRRGEQLAFPRLQGEIQFAIASVSTLAHDIWP